MLVTRLPDRPTHPPPPGLACLQILRDEGLKGLYGTGPMLFIKVAPGVGVSYACFDVISRHLAKQFAHPAEGASQEEHAERQQQQQQRDRSSRLSASELLAEEAAAA